MNPERPRVIASLIIPGLLLIAMWLVKSLEALLGLSFVNMGIYPRSVEGLPGILLSPFIHGDWGHLGANSASMFVLTAALFYFYREIALKSFLGIWLITGLWVWMGAREAWHIGASGVIYGNAAFLFVSGLLRRNPRLSALALFVVFAYGSLIWGIFPQFFPGENISWEGHLSGLLAGSILAVYFRKEGPREPKYSWEFEDEDEDEDEDEQEQEQEQEGQGTRDSSNSTYPLPTFHFPLPTSNF